jgi:hypothetical protein
MFCSILCFVVEDTLNCTSVSNYGVIIDDYWRCLAYMIFCAAIFFLCEIVPREHLESKNKFSWCPFLALLVFSAVNISNILYKYFLGDATQEDKYTFLINIFSIIVYIAWCHFEKSKLREEHKRLYYLIAFAILIAFISIGGYLSNLYMPIGVIRTLKEDSKVQTEIYNLQDVLTNTNVIYKDTEEVINNVSAHQSALLKSGVIKYKKITDTEFILSWNLITDLESAKKNKRLQRICERYYLNKFQSKQGMNERTFKLNKKRSK